MFVIAMLPVFSQYQVGPLDLDVVMMLAFFVIYLFSSPTVTVTSVGKPIAFILVYMLLCTGINMLAGTKFSAKTEILLRMGRYALYLFVVFFLGNKHANYEDLMKMYRIVAISASVYIILQTVFYYGLGIRLPNTIGKASSSENLLDVGRLRSFYSEPAELGYNLAPFVACSLFGKPYKKDTSKTNGMDALLVSVAIVLSTSGQGIFTIAILWAFWLINRIFRKGISTRDALLISGAVLGVVILYASGILEYALGRADNMGEGSAINARSSGYVALSLLSPLQTIFGAGFGNYVVENVFDLSVIFQFVNYSTLAEFLFCFGILGTLIWLVFFIYLFKKGNGCAKIIICILLFMSLLGCPMTGKHFPLWLTVICTQLPLGVFTPDPASAEDPI